jgi:hypothetical protein
VIGPYVLDHSMFSRVKREHGFSALLSDDGRQLSLESLEREKERERERERENIP